MAVLVLGDGAVQALRAGIAGEVLVAGDAGYEDARTIFNAMINRRPAVIVQCERVEDVAASIRFAREHGLEIGVAAAATAWPARRSPTAGSWWTCAA